MAKSPYEKLIREIEREEGAAYERLPLPHRKFVVQVIKAAQEAIAEKEAKEENESQRFYSEMGKGEAVAFIDEIIERANNAWRASKLIEGFIADKMSVEEIEEMLSVSAWLF